MLINHTRLSKEKMDDLARSPHLCLKDPKQSDLKRIPCNLTECMCNCETCGFNRAEAERRLSEGHFVGPMADVILSIRKDDVNKIKKFAAQGPTHLVFKPLGGKS